MKTWILIFLLSLLQAVCGQPDKEVQEPTVVQAVSVDDDTPVEQLQAEARSSDYEDDDLLAVESNIAESRESFDSYSAPQAPGGGYGAPAQDSYGSPAAPEEDSYGAPQAPPEDSYGAPQAPVVDTNIDSYGSPNAPAISNQDSYGAPQAPAVSDSYGAPQAPVYNSGGTKAKDSPPPPPPPPPSDDGYESDLISSFRPVSEEDPIPYPTPDISQSSFGGFNDNLDASVSSFADDISDLSGYAEDEQVQTYNGYFTQDRASYEQSESENENIKPFSNYFDGFDKSDNPTQSSVFSAKSDKIKYYDENGNLIDPEKFKPIDYTPDYFETLGTTTNRRAFESDSKNRNGNKNFGFVGKEDDNYPPFTDINPRRRSQSTNRISTSNPASDSLSSAPSINDIEPFVGGSGFKKSAPEPEKIKEPKPPATTATPYNNIVYKGNFDFDVYIRGVILPIP